MNQIEIIAHNGITGKPALPEVVQIKPAAVREHNDVFDLSFFEPLEVYKDSVFDTDGRELMGSRALRYFHDGSLADTSAVSSSYTLENHVTLFGKHADILRESELPTDNVLVRDEYSDFGMKAKRSIQYLDEAVDMSGSGDMVYCRSDQINSVNSKWAFQQFAGAYRSYCENSMVFGGDKAVYNKVKHSKHFDAASLLRTANTVFGTFRDNIDRFKEWKATPVEDATAGAFIKHICPKDTTGQKRIEREEQHGIEKAEDLNIKKFHALYDLWEEYSRDYSQGGGLGKNKWALYNVLTHYATHTHDSRTFELNGEEKTHVLGRKSANMVNTDRGGYTLNEQMDRARGIWAVLSAPAWASIN